MREDQELCDGFSTKVKLLFTNSSYQRKKFGWESGATEELWCSADFLSGCWCFSSFPWPVCPPPGFLCFFVDVAPNPRILCTSICEFSTATACVLSHAFFLCILSSSQDKMHCTLSLTVCTCTPCQRASFNSTTDSFSWGHDPYTLACKARPSLDRCGTSLSVSLSLSLSLSQEGLMSSDTCQLVPPVRVFVLASLARLFPPGFPASQLC